MDFPGEYHVKDTEFQINGNPLDKYDRTALVSYRQLFMCEEKKEAYYECVGQ